MRELCTIIVTYNRKELLQRCLHAVLAQTRPPGTVLVVNNASTDGTADMLARAFSGVHCLTLPENMGGAGGYHHGIRWAFEHGFRWISVMDDDGYPAQDCLERLLDYDDPTLSVRAPLVLSQQNPAKLAFTLFLDDGAVTTQTQARQVAQNGLIAGRINPFNGIVLAREVVEQIGLPVAEFFLWGDEYEYFLRMKHAGIPLGTVVEAHFYHPPDRMQADRVRLLGREFTVYYADNPLKDYLIVRNQAYIVKKYRGWVGWLAHVARYAFLYWRRAGLRALPGVITASIHGAQADFSHHRKFLS